MVEHPPAMQETWVRSLGWEDPLEEGMATHSSILAWRIPMDGGVWQAAVHGFTKSQTQLSSFDSLTQFSNTRKWHDVIQSIFSNRGWNGKACISINEYLFWSSVEVLIMLWVFDLEPDPSSSMKEFHRRSNEQTTRHSHVFPAWLDLCDCQNWQSQSVRGEARVESSWL